MWTLADWCAKWFVPSDYRNNPDRRGAEQLFRDTARIQILVMALMVVCGVPVIMATGYFYEMAVLWGIIPRNLLGLTVMRLTRNVMWPLLFSSITSM